MFTLFMLTVSLIFSFGSDAPSLFGRNVYIVKTDTVEFLKPGTALFTQSVPFNEIHPGDIVVFNNLENGSAGLAEIESVQENENVYKFEAIGESGALITLTGSQIVGQATHFSDFLGGLISFAKSAAGVMVIAVIPCMIILIYESSKAIFGIFRREQDIKPVRKQDEIPTYVPRQKISGSRHAAKEEVKEDSTLEEDYSRMLAEIAEKDDGFMKEEDDFPLFKQPNSKAIVVGRDINSAPQKPSAPLSQKRLNQAIAEINARKIPENSSNTGRITDKFPFDNTDEVVTITPTGSDNSATYEVGSLQEIKAAAPPAVENVKKYTPKKPAPAQRTTQTTSIPSLDRLLREDDPEVENARYNIEDILFSIDRKR